jgi:hypothetical protein
LEEDTRNAGHKILVEVDDTSALIVGNPLEIKKFLSVKQPNWLSLDGIKINIKKIMK